MMPKPKIAYFTNIAPHYREKLWLQMADEMGVEFHFYFGYKPTQTIKSIDFTTKQWKDLKEQLHLIENIEVNNVLVYQRKVMTEILFNQWDAVILLGHARIFTVWLSAIIARLKGIPVILWGHGLYGSEKPLKKLFLKTFLSLGNVVLVYGDYAKKLIVKEKFKEEKIRVIYNSINYKETKKLRQKQLESGFYRNYFNNDHQTLIFIGRLTKLKKLDLLINALIQLKEHKHNYNLMLIGGGDVDVTEKLKQAVQVHDLNVHFYGPCYNEEKIAELLANADLCISPGSIGLTAVHAMSYGTPVCTHNDFKNQGPEFEAIIPWETGCFFDKTKENLAVTIIKWFNQSPERETVRANCFKVVDTKYNPNVQLKVLKEAVDDVMN